MKIVYLILLVLLSGCASNQTDKLAFMKAFSESVAACKGEAGCVASMNAALYTGAFSKDEDSVTRIISATLPFANLALEVFRTVYNSGGSGQGFNLKNSNNNTFIGFNKNSAKGYATIDNPFSATSEITKTQSWENMYNTDNSQSTVTGQ